MLPPDAYNAAVPVGVTNNHDSARAPTPFFDQAEPMPGLFSFSCLAHLLVWYGRYSLGPYWVWALGARVGKGAFSPRIDFIHPCDADLLTLGTRSFLSVTKVYVDEPVPGRMNVRMRKRVTLGDHSAVGFLSPVPPGCFVGGSAAVGMMTALTADTTVPAEHIAFGNPSAVFPITDASKLAAITQHDDTWAHWFKENCKWVHPPLLFA